MKTQSGEKFEHLAETKRNTGEVRPERKLRGQRRTGVSYPEAHIHLLTAVTISILMYICLSVRLKCQIQKLTCILAVLTGL